MNTIHQNYQVSHRVNSQPGEYFVTICTKNKECNFGEIVSDDVKLSPIGRIAEQCWKEIPNHFTNVELDA
jgi:putative transposase